MMWVTTRVISKTMIHIEMEKWKKREREKQGREYISLYHANFVLQKKVRVNAKISLSWKKKKRIERKALYNLTAVDQYSTDIL